jgi:hypothetical protein
MALLAAKQIAHPPMMGMLSTLLIKQEFNSSISIQALLAGCIVT